MLKNRLSFILTIIVVSTIILSPVLAQSKEHPLLKGAYRLEKEGWIYAHLEGTPFQVGYQNGYLLYDNIDIAFKANIHIWWTDEEEGDLWYQARDISKLYIWPKLTAEIKQEIEGIAAGIRARGLKWDKWDILAFNAWGDIPVYFDLYETHQRNLGGGHIRLPRGYPRGASCSAFLATGSYTTDGRIVMGHNTWAGYADWGYCQVIIDIKPKSGHRIMYQSFGGSVWSGPDWLLNDAGLMVTETTLPDMYVYDPKGVPVFVRERVAIQYASSIDEFIEIMTTRNNGGYANDWLVGDAKTGEICSLELGCKKWDIIRAFDGFITSCNYPRGPNVRSETVFDWEDPSTSGYCRNERWTEIKDYYSDPSNLGSIDVSIGEDFESDHWDTYTGLNEPSLRTLCGHGEDETPTPPYAWGDPWPDGGATDGKVTDSVLVMDGMGMWARFGHPCGTVFDASDFLLDHPELSWELPYLRDLPPDGPVEWAYFEMDMTI